MRLHIPLNWWLIKRRDRDAALCRKSEKNFKGDFFVLSQNDRRSRRRLEIHFFQTFFLEKLFFLFFASLSRTCFLSHRIWRKKLFYLFRLTLLIFSSFLIFFTFFFQVAASDRFQVSETENKEEEKSRLVLFFRIKQNNFSTSATFLGTKNEITLKVPEMTNSELYYLNYRYGETLIFECCSTLNKLPNVF